MAILDVQTVTDPDHHQGREGALGHGVENHDQRIDRVLQMTRVDDGDGEADPRAPTKERIRRRLR